MILLVKQSTEAYMGSIVSASFCHLLVKRRQEANEVLSGGPDGVGSGAVELVARANHGGRYGCSDRTTRKWLERAVA